MNTRTKTEEFYNRKGYIKTDGRFFITLYNILVINSVQFKDYELKIRLDISYIFSLYIKLIFIITWL